MHYLEMNPVRAKMVDSPADYRWSSYAANAWGFDNAIIQAHQRYFDLGSNQKTRQSRYRSFFKTDLASNELELIRACLQSGTPMGNERFKQQIESTLGRSVGELKRGRPAKSAR